MKLTLLLTIFIFTFAIYAQSIQDQYSCEENNLVAINSGKIKISFDSAARCEQALESAKFQVICRHFDMQDKNIGVGSRPSVGWRPSNIDSLMGLGRYTFPSFEKCLKATDSSSSHYVCTNTGGDNYKSTHVESNLWCGSSVLDQYCFEVNPQLKANVICSYPSDGLGKYDGWMVTEIDSSCHYKGPKMSYQACLEKINTMEGK
jgi:hypothetical protein